MGEGGLVATVVASDVDGGFRSWGGGKQRREGEGGPESEEEVRGGRGRLRGVARKSGRLPRRSRSRRPPRALVHACYFASAYWQRLKTAALPRPPPASPGHLLLPPRRPGDATRLPDPPLTSPFPLDRSPSSGSLFPSLPCDPRAQPSPPFAIAAATSPPSPLRQFQKLRR